MKRLILIAAGGLMLTSAAPPAPGGADAGTRNYPACTAKKSDRCVQSNERGSAVATAARGESELDSVVAAGAPRARAEAGPVPITVGEPIRRTARANYPRCSATVRDRCVQGGSAVASRRSVETRRVQLAMRAGERG